MKKHKMRLSRAHFALTGPERRAASIHFSVSLKDTTENGGCAVVVSKKVAKLSVSRHLLKRRVLAAVRPWCLSTRVFIIYARPLAPSLSYQALEQELRELLARMMPEVR